jgi:hypothetical protein
MAEAISKSFALAEKPKVANQSNKSMNLELRTHPSGIAFLGKLNPPSAAELVYILSHIIEAN